MHHPSEISEGLLQNSPLVIWLKSRTPKCSAGEVLCARRVCQVLDLIPPSAFPWVYFSYFGDKLAMGTKQKSQGLDTPGSSTERSGLAPGRTRRSLDPNPLLLPVIVLPKWALKWTPCRSWGDVRAPRRERNRSDSVIHNAHARLNYQVGMVQPLPGGTSERRAGRGTDQTDRVPHQAWNTRPGTRTVPALSGTLRS